MYKSTIRRHTRKATATAALAVVSLVLAACASSESDGGEGESTDTGSASTSELTEAQIAWAADYIHGKPGTKADESLKPVVVGFLNQQGGLFDFVEGEVAADATVKFINEELGGIDGHPVELRKCLLATTEDAQKCGSEMANDNDVNAIVIPAVFLNPSAVYNAIDGKKTIFDNTLIFPEDFTAKNVFAFAPTGAASGQASAAWAKELDVDRVAIIRTDNPAGLSGAQAFSSALKAVGIDFIEVPVPEPGTAPEYAAAIRNAGVKNGDGLFPVLSPTGCASLYDGLRAQKLEPVVIADMGCASLPPMPDRMKAAGQDNTDFPDGWYQVHWGYSVFQPEENKSGGTDTYVNMLHKYAGKDAVKVGYAPSAFIDTMAAARFIQEAGIDADGEAIAAKARAFTGPAALTPSSVKCGAIADLPNICTSSSGLSRFKDGEWTSIADGLNGKFIDLLTTK